MRIVVAFVAAMVLSVAAHADTRRTSTAYQFRKTHECPLTNKIQRTCPGYIIDHVVPLCAGGADSVANLQWQTKEASYEKDKLERAQCRATKKGLSL